MLIHGVIGVPGIGPLRAITLGSAAGANVNRGARAVGAAEGDGTGDATMGTLGDMPGEAMGSGTDGTGGETAGARKSWRAVIAARRGGGPSGVGWGS